MGGRGASPSPNFHLWNRVHVAWLSSMEQLTQPYGGAALYCILEGSQVLTDIQASVVSL